MTSAEIRQSFLDFFQEKQHTIVPSASLLPQSPGLLFTNAGMNQFVPYFLGEQAAPYSPPRAADTQKCIRAGGKHNDLEDVGYDTYHHTLFEMLGNWSFGDYFKTEAINWAWELLVERWGFPAHRLYATVYSPSEGDPSHFDQEAYDLWSAKFQAKGLDPKIHIVNGNVKDNFWMMGDTGPCGPCSELHVDMTPEGDTQGKLVNADSDLCIEIWNLVFIQYNAEADGRFRDLPAKHVDTGMGFERVVSIIQNTKGFTDFSQKPTNYNTDTFSPLFRKLEALTGKKYLDIYPNTPEADKAILEDAIAFRVIADHIRTLSLSIADGILPGNNGRNYVLRRILRRAVKYGRTLGFSGDKTFLADLVDTLVEQLGDIFPELKTKSETVKAALRREEESFNQTLDRGMQLFEDVAAGLASEHSADSGGEHSSRVSSSAASGTGSEVSPPSAALTASGARYSRRNLPHFERPWGKYLLTFRTFENRILTPESRKIVLDACQHFHNERYFLYAAVVMPDHVHLLLEPSVKELDSEKKPLFWGLGQLLHSIKSFTANEINKLEDQTNPVWQKESYDRLIRSESDLREKYDYVILNPQRAELPDWEAYPFLYAQGWNAGDLATQREEVLAALGSAPSLPQDAEDHPLEAGSPPSAARAFPPAEAFKLSDTFGFPIDLTALLCRERGLSLDEEAVETLFEQARKLSQENQQTTVVAALDLKSEATTHFIGFDNDECEATILELHPTADKLLVITDRTTFFAEMGGQQGDEGEMRHAGSDAEYLVSGTQQIGSARAHLVPPQAQLEVGDKVTLRVFAERRRPIEAHHTATHLLHWALHEVVSTDATQQGSLVTPDRLRFDFTSSALSPDQLTAIEDRVNAAIAEAQPVSWQEVPHTDIKGRGDIMQFFGDKYGDLVRVVQIGGQPLALDGYSMELCGGTHARNTSELGQFIIKKEEAIASGVRRIEAAVGHAATAYIAEQVTALKEEFAKAEDKLAAANEALAALKAEPLSGGSLPARETLPALQSALHTIKTAAAEAEKSLKKAQTANAARAADAFLADLAENGGLSGNVVHSLDGPANLLQELINGLKKLHFTRAAFLIVDDGAKLHLGALCGKDAHDAGLGAGNLIQDLAPLAGGKGGGKPDMARGAAPQRDQKSKVVEAAQKALA